MKKIIMLLTVAMAVACQAEARKAVLVAHYGSSDDVTRSKTLDMITSDIREALPGIEVREAYISPVVRRKLASKGIESKSTVDALIALKADGFDTVYVQPTTLLEGAETAEVRNAASVTSPFFSLVKVGNPLCYSPEDCLELVEVLGHEACGKGESVVYVGHGNGLPSTATYSQLDYMFAAEGKPNYHVSTIEGYPTAETTIRQLAASGDIKKVKLVPLLLVCGNHTKNDIAGDFASAVRNAGYKAEVVMRGLGESPEVRQLYVEKVKRLVSKKN